MAITDELRLFAADPYTGWVPTDKQQADLRAIADRIDEKHEREVQQAHADGLNEQMDFHDNFIPSNYIALPVDADGVPIRIGDVLDEIAVATYPFVPAKVVGYHECCGEVLPIVENDGEFQVIPEKVCHYRAPTVEDVLREFADAMSNTNPLDVPARIAEYAAKLRLAGEE